MHPEIHRTLLATRRHLLGSMAGGIGSIALGELLGSRSTHAANEAITAIPSASIEPLAALAALSGSCKSVIVIHLTGSPPHLDLYDHKPQLVQRDGEECPPETIAGKKFAFTSGTPKLLGTRRTFVRLR